MQKRIGRAIATTYLSTISQNRKLDVRTFSKWTLINAAERTYHGMPSEKETLKRYIERYLAEWARGTDEDYFYKMV